MLKLEAIAAIVAIAQSGSMSAAAQRLGIAKSVVSERLAGLERALGTTLVQRTTRRLSLTEDGVAFVERAKKILADVESAATDTAKRRGNLVGPLRISAPVGFGSLHLGAPLFGFLAKYPGIELALELDDRFVNVLTDGFDAVIRHGPVDDSRIIVKRLAESRRLLVASPGYLKRFGTPGSLAELNNHRGIMYSNRGAADWRFRVGRKFINVHPASSLRFNNGVMMRDASAAGLGVALLPAFFLQQSLSRRLLKEIEIDAEAQGATIYIAYPEHLRLSAKIRALTEWLQRAFVAPNQWD